MSFEQKVFTAVILAKLAIAIAGALWETYRARRKKVQKGIDFGIRYV